MPRIHSLFYQCAYVSGCVFSLAEASFSRAARVSGDGEWFFESEQTSLLSATRTKRASELSEDDGETIAVTHEGKPDPNYACQMSWCRRENCERDDPACCNMHMNKMFQAVAGFLTRRGHNFAPTAGTLLGAVRDKKIIPWTADMDISVSEDGIEALLGQKEIPYRFFRDRDAGIVRGCPMEPGGDRRYFVPPGGVASPTHDNHHQVLYYMDVYPDAFIQGEGHPMCVRSGHAHETVQIYDKWYPSVINSTECLTSKYGSLWHVPSHTHRLGRSDQLQLTSQNTNGDPNQEKVPKRREREGERVQLARKEALVGELYESDLTRQEARSWQKGWKISISMPLFFIRIVFPSIALAVTAYLIFTLHQNQELQRRPPSTSRSWVTLAWFVLCFALLVSVDILVKVNASNAQQTPLVLIVLLAEAGKLFLSLVSLVISAIRVKPGTSDAQGAIAKGATIRLGLDLLPVTLAFSMNNVLSFYVLSVMRFDAAVVWRNCSILFTAIFWTALLNRPLGFNRKLAVVLCLVGCFINSFASDGALEVDGATPFVLLQAASTAVGSVLNEKVIKSERAKHRSLDLVNSLLYSEMTIVLCCCCFAQHLAFGTSLSFATFTPRTWIVILVYASVGLTVSRVLKYGDSVSYSIMSGLRSPAGILLAPVFVSGSHVSIGAVTSGAMVFLAVIFNATPDRTGETKPLVAHKQ